MPSRSAARSPVEARTKTSKYSNSGDNIAVPFTSALESSESGQNGTKKLSTFSPLPTRRHEVDTDGEVASLDALDEYIELLYEDLPSKIRCTKLVLSLVLDQEGVQVLAMNESLMAALSRTLREDAKRSLSLATNIVAIFYQISQNPQLIPILTSNKVGDMGLKLLDHEIKRYDVLAAPLGRAAINPSKSAAGSENTLTTSPDSSFGSLNNLSQAKSEPQAIAKRRALLVLEKQDALVYGVLGILSHLAQDPCIQGKMSKRGAVKQLLLLLDRPTDNAPVIHVIIKLLIMLSQFQDNLNDMRESTGWLNTIVALVRIRSDAPLMLVRDCMRLMLNLSHHEDWRSELVRVGLINQLIAQLGEPSTHVGQVSIANAPELLLLLYQLSCDERGRTMFPYTEALPLILQQILNHPKNETLPVELMALVLNLSTNEHSAEILCDGGSVLKKLVKRLTRNRDYLLLKFLRNLSMHTSLHIPFLDVMDVLVELYLATSALDIKVEILGLLANLRVANVDFTKLLLSYPGLTMSLSSIIVNALTPPPKQDGNTVSSSTSRTSSPHLSSRPNSTVQSKTPQTWISVDDDLALEVVTLCGTLALDTGTGEVLCAAKIPQNLLQLMHVREDDDEMVLQLLFAFHHLLQSAAPRQQLLPFSKLNAGSDSGSTKREDQESDLIAPLIDLLYDRNPLIRAMCDRCLDLICDLQNEETCDVDGKAAAIGSATKTLENDWARRIRSEKFYFHNAEWITLTAHDVGHANEENADHAQQATDEFKDEEDEYEEDDSNPFGNVKLVCA